MKSVNNTIIEKLNKMENFTLRYDGGRTVLWDINAPGLHVLTVSHHYMKFAGEKGKWALLYHSFSDDFFKKTYAILDKVGLTEETAPEIWGYIRKLNKYSAANVNPEIKAITNEQLFTFIQDFLENILYKEYLIRTKKKIRENHDVFKELLVAADSFVVRGADGSIQTMAGYPWFDQNWGRDTFVSLPGLLLVTERYEYAKSVFSFYAKHQNKDGLLPNRIFSHGQKDYNSADASLWFIEALNRYYLSARSKDAENFIKKMLPVVNKVIDYYTRPAGDIHLDKDALVVVPGQWTWMDSAPMGAAVTPRNGKPVEVQALFYNALGIASKFNLMLGNKKLASQCEELKKETARSINARFFGGDRGYPYDVVDGDPHGNAIRPNALFLLSLSDVGDLLPPEKKQTILEVVEKELMTRYGPRTLSPLDPRYIGRYDTFAPMAVKDLAYHQGNVWPYLMAQYVLAKKNVMGEKKEKEFADEISGRVKDLMHFVRNNETLPEVFSGNEPYAPGGTVSQAWSVAAMLEIFDMLYTDSEALKKIRVK